MTGTDLEVQNVELVPAGTLFGTDNPAEVVRRSTAIATELARLVRQQKLVVRIGQSEHVKVEGWTLLGSQVGVFAVVEWTRPVLDTDGNPIGWEARVEARTLAGNVVSAAEAECLRDERTWQKRDDYALRSMAQTRAVSKALRLVLGFVMQLAGFDPTPADEMPTRFGGDPMAAGTPPTAANDDSRTTPTAGAVTQAIPREPASPPDDPAAGTPFSYEVGPLDAAAVAPTGSTATEGKPATEAQKKKLNTLLGIHTKGLDDEQAQHFRRRLYATVALKRVQSVDALLLDVGGLDEHYRVHWGPLRDSLTRGEAHDLIDRLEKLEAP
jgi:hypothetical protein